MRLAKPFFGGNWKMNQGPTATREFVTRFAGLYPVREDRTVVFFPPAISVAAFDAAAKERRDLQLGVQDVYWEASGAFTGSISAGMAKDAGAGFVLAGHSATQMPQPWQRAGLISAVCSSQREFAW